MFIKKRKFFLLSSFSSSKKRIKKKLCPMAKEGQQLLPSHKTNGNHNGQCATSGDSLLSWMSITEPLNPVSSWSGGFGPYDPANVLVMPNNMKWQMELMLPISRRGRYRIVAARELTSTDLEDSTYTAGWSSNVAFTDVQFFLQSSHGPNFCMITHAWNGEACIQRGMQLLLLLKRSV